MRVSGKRLLALVLPALIAAGAASAQEVPPALGEAMALVEQGDAAGAIAALDELVEQPGAPEIAFAALGALLLETGNAERALAVLAPLADRAPPDPAALFNAGRAAEALGRIQDAASYYQRSIEIEPLSPALRALGMMIGRLGRAGATPTRTFGHGATRTPMTWTHGWRLPGVRSHSGGRATPRR